MRPIPLLVILATLSGLALSATYLVLPEAIPLNWDLQGRVGTWGARANIFWMAALPLVVLAGQIVLPRLDPKGEAYKRHEGAWASIVAILCLSFMALGWITAAAALGLPLDSGRLVRLLIGIIFAGLGNYLGKIRPNWFLGIRSPWTLADPEVWRVTHRQGAWVTAGTGLAFIASALLSGSLALGIVLGVLLIGGQAYLLVYSYLLWRRRVGSSAEPGN